MTRKEFVFGLFAYYEQEMDTETGKIRLKMLDKWLEKNIQDKHLSAFFDKVLENFIATGVNRIPLIPQLSKIYTDIDSYRDVAVKLASAIVDKVFKYGYYGLGSYEKNAPKKDLEIVKAFSGSIANFYHRFNDLENEKINLAQLRDFIIAKFKTENINKNKTLKQLLGDRTEVLQIENKRRELCE